MPSFISIIIYRHHFGSVTFTKKHQYSKTHSIATTMVFDAKNQARRFVINNSKILYRPTVQLLSYPQESEDLTTSQQSLLQNFLDIDI